MSGPLSNLLTAPLLARGLGPDERGQYGVALSVAALALSVGVVGQPDVFLSRARLGISTYASSMKVMLVGTIAAAISGIFGIAMLGLPPLLAVASCLWLPALGAAMMWRSATISGRNTTLPAAAIGVGNTARLLALLALVALGALSSGSAVIATQLAIIVGALAFTFRPARSQANRPPEATAWTVTKLGLPIVGFNALTAITMRSDLIVLQITSTPYEVGVYAAAAGLTAAGLALSTGFRNRVQAALFADSPRAEIRREWVIVLLLAIVGAAVGIFAAPVIVDVLFGPGYESAVPVLRVLAGSTAALIMLDLAHGALLVLGSRSRLYVTAGTGAIATIIALSVLTPSFGAVGAAAATLVGYTVAALLGTVLVFTAPQLAGPTA